MNFITFSSISLFLLASIVIGTSYSLVLGFDSTEFSWLMHQRVSISLVSLIIPLIGLISNNGNGSTILLLLLTATTFIYVIYLSKSFDIIIVMTCHYLCTIFFCFTATFFDLYVSLIGCLLLLDVLSVLQVCMVPGSVDRVGSWSYLLYQACLTMLAWLCLCFNLSFFVCFLWFMKLGAGFTGFYLPSLYRALSSCNGTLMYIGVVTIFQSWCSYLLLSRYFNLNLMTSWVKYILILLILVSMFYVIINWCYNLDWLIALNLYGLCISTMFTIGSVFLIMFLGTGGLFTKTIISSFLLMSQISWCILVICLNIN